MKYLRTCKVLTKCKLKKKYESDLVLRTFSEIEFSWYLFVYQFGTYLSRID